MGTAGSRAQAITKGQMLFSRDEASVRSEISRAKGKEEVVVLVVDDQEMVRAVCQQVVESLGFRALTAESASEALELLEQQPIDIRPRRHQDARHERH